MIYDLRRALYGDGWELRESGIAVPPGTATREFAARILEAERAAADRDRQLAEQIRQLFRLPQDPDDVARRPGWYDFVG